MDISIYDAISISMNLTDAEALETDAFRVCVDVCIPGTDQIAELGTVRYPVQESPTGKRYIQTWPERESDEQMLMQLDAANYRVTTVFRDCFDRDCVCIVIEQRI